MINNKSCVLFFVMLIENDINIEKRTINEHFSNKKISGCGRGKFIKNDQR